MDIEKIIDTLIYYDYIEDLKVGPFIHKGKKCLGIECYDPAKTIMDLMQVLSENLSSEELPISIDMLKNPKIFSLVPLRVLFWPDIKWPSSYNAEE
jgi:hypothetical protein